MERLIIHSIKSIGSSVESMREIGNMAEDVKNMIDMPEIIVKWSRYLRDLVDTE